MNITGYRDKHEYISDKGVKSTVYLMDCMKLMHQVPDGWFELACVDPPYGIANLMQSGGNNIDFTNKKKKIKRGQKGKLHSVNEMQKWDICPDEQYYKTLKQKTVNQIVWGANYMPSLLNVLGVSRCWICWDKVVSENFTLSQFELAYTSFNKISKKFTYAHSLAVGFAPGLKGVEKIGLGIHPTQKPVKLYDWIYANYAKPTDKILDTHLGSGSNRIAAHRAGLEFVGCEINEEYFYKSVKRFEDHVAQLTLF